MKGIGRRERMSSVRSELSELKLDTEFMGSLEEFDSSIFMKVGFLNYQ